MNDRLFSLRLFTRIARTGSFSRAGRELGLSQPSVSRITAALEQDVGVSLLNRTTRAVTLTEAGADYLARIEPILAALEEADHAVRGTGELKGTLRVALSASFALRIVIPNLPAFMARHPSLNIDLLMNDQWQDLVKDGVDVGLRIGALTDSTATARSLGAMSRLLVASPQYLTEVGTPQTPADLASHTFIFGPSGTGLHGWSFHKEGRKVSIHVEGKLTTSLHEGAITAALSGLGIASTGVWGCYNELLNGDLIQILSDWRMESTDINAVFPSGRAAKPAARAFVEHIKGVLDTQVQSLKNSAIYTEPI